MPLHFIHVRCEIKTAVYTVVQTRLSDYLLKKLFRLFNFVDLVLDESFHNENSPIYGMYRLISNLHFSQSRLSDLFLPGQRDEFKRLDN